MPVMAGVFDRRDPRRAWAAGPQQLRRRVHDAARRLAARAGARDRSAPSGWCWRPSTCCGSSRAPCRVSPSTSGRCTDIHTGQLVLLSPLVLLMFVLGHLPLPAHAADVGPRADGAGAMMPLAAVAVDLNYTWSQALADLSQIAPIVALTLLPAVRHRRRPRAAEGPPRGRGGDGRGARIFASRSRRPPIDGTTAPAARPTTATPPATSSRSSSRSCSPSSASSRWRSPTRT